MPTPTDNMTFSSYFYRLLCALSLPYSDTQTPFKGSRASLTSTIKLDTDDEQSLLEYGEPDTGKFNEDGSFIGVYQDRPKRGYDSTV